MDRASHLFGKCSECHETICVEKAVADQQNTQPETNEMIYKAFRTHVKLKHSEDASSARRAETKQTLDDYRKKVGS
jgi:predicted ATP-dependent serine protease